MSSQARSVGATVSVVMLSLYLYLTERDESIGYFLSPRFFVILA
jgi:hypothetical protein